MADLKQLFSQYQNKKVALYGLGVETEKVINELNDFCKIVGLLDSFREDGSQFGKKVIPIAEAVAQQVELIIVVARPGSCKAIAKKIEDRCRSAQIALYDVRGKDLLIVNQVVYDFQHMNGVTRKEMLESIAMADVVSFDLFDTLVMRRTLDATDVFACVNSRLYEKGILIENFCDKRLESEKKLSKNEAPTLNIIYEDVVNKCNITEISAEALADLEWLVDYEVLTPRKDMCDIFKKTYATGKRVYVTSDTYYSKRQLKTILEKCDITEFTDILSSSEYNTAKTQGLFDILVKKERGKRILHIGDDLVADEEKALDKGIETCRIYSATELFESVGCLGISDNLVDLSERIKIGMFISHIFNSPFQFETVEKRIQVASLYDIGYLFCAPMISDFMIWFHEKAQELQLENIWFGARDGFLLHKMYKELIQEKKGTYFLTSRIAAIRAGMKCEEDIQYVDEMKFSGSLEQNLKERFGICADAVTDESMQENGLLKYKSAILSKAQTERKNYLRYIKKLNTHEGKTAFFDFVAKGTTQMYLNRLLDTPLVGLYFLQLEAEYMMDKGLNIFSFYSKEDDGDSAIYENYYILETILTAPHASVCGFDEEGEPCYHEETRTDRDIQSVQQVQNGIEEYFRDYLKLCPPTEQKVNKKLDELFLKLIHGIVITNKDFLSLVVEDPFFNRKTNITDLL